jgi:PilZ domain
MVRAAADSRLVMDVTADDTRLSLNSVLAEVTCAWDDAEDKPGGEATAAIVHRAPEMLVLEASDPNVVLPPLGTVVRVNGQSQVLSGRLAEHGRGGRFLLALGDRPVRGSLRLRVSLPATLRSPFLTGPVAVEIVDLTTGGARLRGAELAVGTQLTLDFTPPGREQAVMVRAVVAHGTHQADKPWMGVRFRLVAMRGGR